MTSGQLARWIGAALAGLALLAPAARAQSSGGTASGGQVVNRTPEPGTNAPVPESALPPPRRGLDITEHLGRALPLELDFTNSAGKRVYLKDYFSDNRPAIVVMVYYRCPLVCPVVMEKLGECINKLDLTVGKDFKVLVFSFNPAETSDEAARLRNYYLAGYPKDLTEPWKASWEFHTGEAASNKTLADAFGFHYKRLENGEYSHPVAFFVVTPDGKIARYIYGFDYPVRDVKLALNEAASGRLMTSLGDRLAAFCYMWDPSTGGYALKAIRVMQVGGILTLIALAFLIGTLLVVERLKKAGKKHAAPTAPDGPVVAAGTISNEGTR